MRDSQPGPLHVILNVCLRVIPDVGLVHVDDVGVQAGVLETETELPHLHCKNTIAVDAAHVKVAHRFGQREAAYPSPQVMRSPAHLHVQPRLLTILAGQLVPTHHQHRLRATRTLPPQFPDRQIHVLAQRNVGVDQHRDPAKGGQIGRDRQLCLLFFVGDLDQLPEGGAGLDADDFATRRGSELGGDVLQTLLALAHDQEFADEGDGQIEHERGVQFCLAVWVPVDVKRDDESGREHEIPAMLDGSEGFALRV